MHNERVLVEADLFLAKILIGIGIMPNLIGFHQVKDAIIFALQNHSFESITAVYLALAAKYGKSACNIEKNIRTAINQAFKCGQLKNLNQILEIETLGESYCLTNGQLIALLTSHVYQKIIAGALLESLEKQSI